MQNDAVIDTRVDTEVDIDQDTQILSPARLMWWKFTRHKFAVVSLVFLALMYIVAAFTGFFAPYDPATRFRTNIYVPPQMPHIVHEGRLSAPFVYDLTQSRDMETLQPIYTPDRTKKYPIRFFVRGERTHILFGLAETDLHLFGTDEGGAIHLVGTDQLGRDVLSRLIFGAEISLTVGLVAVFLSLLLGLIIGGVSGLYGGWVDNLVQRLIEAIIAIPKIPFWMGLAAAIPRDFSPIESYFAILIVLSLLSWTSTARVARGRFLAVREQDFVMAAQLYGASRWRIITRHLIPSIMSYVIVNITLAVPGIILAETALSFLGIGLTPPTVSWGVLLETAQNPQTVSFYPWLWIGPAVCVIVVVLAFNFVGDGARDAADPFSN